MISDFWFDKYDQEIPTRPTKPPEKAKFNKQILKNPNELPDLLFSRLL